MPRSVERLLRALASKKKRRPRKKRGSALDVPPQLVNYYMKQAALASQGGEGYGEGLVGGKTRRRRKPGRPRKVGRPKGRGLVGGADSDLLDTIAEVMDDKKNVSNVIKFKKAPHPAYREEVKKIDHALRLLLSERNNMLRKIKYAKQTKDDLIKAKDILGIPRFEEEPDDFLYTK